MAIVYPTTLPKPNVSGNNTKTTPTFLRSEFLYDIQQRGIFGETVSVTFTFLCESRDVTKAFLNFYYTDLNNGILPFEADWPVYGNTAVKTFRFSEPISMSAEGLGIYTISCQFDISENINEIINYDILLSEFTINYDMTSVITVGDTVVIENGA